MTAKQFIKIMIALEMTCKEANALLDGRRPKTDEIEESAREMADEMNEAEPKEPEISTFDKLLRIADGMERGGITPTLPMTQPALQAVLGHILTDLEYLDDVARLTEPQSGTLRGAICSVQTLIRLLP